MKDLKSLVLATPPPLDPAWLAHEEAAGLRNPKPPLTAPERQPIYAAECRARNASMMLPGARDHHLSQGIHVEPLNSTVSVRSSNGDGYEIPVLRYELEQERKAGVDDEEVILIYIHGGGLLVGEADSEDLSCRRLVKHFAPTADGSPSRRLAAKLYSIGYRLMPQVPAQTCVSDVQSALEVIQGLHQNARFILIGSSSGGELAALVSQSLPPGSLAGVLLRCPVTIDAPKHVPTQLREWHTSASEPFTTSLLGLFNRQLPRDGLGRMPLEILPEDVKSLKLPRTWIQVCTNDVLYSDGMCYAKILQDAGVDVEVDVVEGWPHTFWLKAPHLNRALEADEAMVHGLDWVMFGTTSSR